MWDLEVCCQTSVNAQWGCPMTHATIMYQMWMEFSNIEGNSTMFGEVQCHLMTYIDSHQICCGSPQKFIKKEIR